ncbi:MAG: Holliday junction resolvase RuvX [Bacilli bacterium]|nr:Holliday junction resolvase RuvX [Bacilli bacterium]
MRCLGLDLGSKTLGISISDKTNLIASVYTTLYFKDEDYHSLIMPLKEIIDKEEIDTLVLGLPKNMNNTLGERALITLEFKDMLESELNIKVIMEDERLTSVISNNVLIDANVSRMKRKKKVDGMAAVIILQGYLDRNIRGE